MRIKGGGGVLSPVSDQNEIARERKESETQGHL